MYACRQAIRGSGAVLRPAISLIELVVVMSVVSIFAAMLMPALQSARELSRQVTCRNNIAQLAKANALHVNTHGHFPTNGWGYSWVGDTDKGFGANQPGGWCFNILPYIEQGAVRELARRTSYDSSQNDRIHALLVTPIANLYCPSRRAAESYRYGNGNGEPSLRGVHPPGQAARTDYAICAGDSPIHTPPGPETDTIADLLSYDWPESEAATGVSYVRTMIRPVQVSDGLSHTLLLGEKSIAVGYYVNAKSIGDDQAAYIGDDADIRRWAGYAPLSDRVGFDDCQAFGSPHPSGCIVAFCDGSVHTIAFGIDDSVFRTLGNRADGGPHGKAWK